MSTALRGGRAPVIDAIVRDMNRDGFSIARGMADPTKLRVIAERLDTYYDRDHARFGREFLKEINELETVRNVIEYDTVFLDLLLELRTMDAAIEALLHKYAIIHNYNLIRLFPEYKTRMLGHQWHRDVYYFGSGIRTAVNVIIPLQDMASSNGATEVLPGSHLQRELPADDVVATNRVSADAKIGDVLFVDAATFHKAGTNTSEATRTIITIKYTLSFFTQQYDFCRSLPVGDFPEPIRGRLGYHVRVAENIEQFRVRPEERRYRWPIRY